MTLYGEGSNASLNSKASDLSQSSGERRNSDAQKGAACSKVTSMVRGSNASSTNQESDLSQSSGERRTHSSEGEETQTLRRERHAQR